MNDRFGLIKESINDGRCEVRVQDRQAWHSDHRCPNKAKVIVRGAHYCTIHDPVKIAARDKEKEKKFEEKCNKYMYQFYAAGYCKKRNLTLDDLKGDKNKP